MAKLMRCEYCGLLQDEPVGVKSCSRCGGELSFEKKLPGTAADYIGIQMELDQVAAPAGQNVERYLLVTIRTPKEVPPQEMPPARQTRPPVNFCAVLDVSGSMGGAKLDQAKQAVRLAVQYLRPGDVFSLVTFSSTVACPFEPILVDEKTSLAVEACLQTIHAGSQTALDGGLKLGIVKAQVHKFETNLVMLLSDGQTNVGELDLEVIGARAMQARQQGMLVSALGIGGDYNEALLAEIATQGGGRFYHIQDANQIPAYVAGELGEVAMFGARDARIHLAIPPGATLVPLSAAYPVVQSEGEAVVSAGDIPCATELEIPLRLALVGGAAGSKLSIDGRLTFRSPAGHDLEVPLNRVTVRFVAQGQFVLREGVVAPVVERVLSQMKAASVLGFSRIMAHKPGEAQQRISTTREDLRLYASLLGEERAEQEAGVIAENLSAMYISAPAAKQAVSDAFTAQRGSKKFGRKS
jgi:Ca-activated chloride channel family protein